jgi:flagellar biosynthesis GTPase FlhF
MPLHAGQFICGNKHCEAKEDLKSYEVNFQYAEAGETKNALVKLRLCPPCAYKLNYKKEQQKKKEEKKRKRKVDKEERKLRKKMKKEGREDELDELERKKAREAEELAEQERIEREEKEKAEREAEKAKNVWKKDAQVEQTKNRSEEFEGACFFPEHAHDTQHRTRAHYEPSLLCGVCRLLPRTVPMRRTRLSHDTHMALIKTREKRKGGKGGGGYNPGVGRKKHAARVMSSSC